MNIGWIKLPRYLLEDPIMMKAELLQLYIYCLLRANHKDTEIIWNGEKMTVKRGSFVTGRKVIAEDLSVNESKVYRALKKLEKLSYISIKVNSRFSVINIIDIGVFENQENKSEQQVNNKCTTSEHQMNTDNNDKNEDNENNIFNIWNSKNIVVHKELNDKLSGIIRNKLNNYSEQELCEAIENYRRILNSDKHYLTHRWTLGEFLSGEKFETFLNINKPFENYIKNNYSTNPTGASYKPYVPEKTTRGHYLDDRLSSLNFIKENIFNKYVQRQIAEAKKKWNITDEELHSDSMGKVS